MSAGEILCNINILDQTDKESCLASMYSSHIRILLTDKMNPTDVSSRDMLADTSVTVLPPQLKHDSVTNQDRVDSTFKL